MSKLEQNTTSLQSLLDKVNMLQDGVTPTGTMKITENGTYDVTNTKTVEVEASSSNVVTINIDWSGDAETICEVTYVSNNTIQTISYYSGINVIEAQGGIVALYGYSEYSYTANFLHVTDGVLMALQDGETVYMITSFEQ